MKGLFITFEGPDGSGKTTQIKKVAQYLREKDISFILTREPGGTCISDDIRSILLNPEYNELTSETEILLYAASRAQHVHEIILPALKNGNVVLCDRFVDASIAYQGYGLGIPVEKVVQINEFAINGLTPNRTYYIDVDPTIARARMLAREVGQEEVKGLDRIEQKQLDYHMRVREGFQRIYEENKQRMVKIDGGQSISTVFDTIIADLERELIAFKK